ncbi:MAG: TrkH family potassium uptake protein [Bacteroidaceae bacterium]|nr:TrkH family potassium uptake protein [Bacteroidaceae bacterium]
MFHPKIIFRVIGYLLFLEALAITSCLGLSLYGGESIVMAYVWILLILLGAGALLLYLGRGAKKGVSRKDSYVVVTLCWLIFPAFAALPFYFSGYMSSMTDAFFEAVSGFTTTGASVIDNLEEYPPSLLFWRSLTQWIGGLGIVFFTVAVMPVFGKGNMPLLAAESVGPIRTKLHPQVAVTSRWILMIYLCLTVASVVSLELAGMNLFDAVCHSMAAVSTGGFSTKQASIAAYQSPSIEYVVTLFMFLGGTNFSLLYMLLIKRRPGELFKDGEFRTYLKIIVVFTFILSVGLFFTTSMNVEEAFRNAIFQVVTILTTTGFCTLDYMTWMPLLWLMVSFLMYLGACTGSTTGGIKCVRIRLLGRIIANEFKKIMHPNLIAPVKLGNKVIQDRVMTSIVAFILIYLGVVAVGLTVNMAFGLNFIEAYGLSLTSVGNVGPGLGFFGPANTMSSLPDVLKWFSCFQMLVGRLEFFAVFVLFTQAFWKKQ